MSSQLLSLCVASHWWSGVISASQFTQLDSLDLSARDSGGAGVKTRGAGDGGLFKQGEMGVEAFAEQGELLSISFSGDSTSLSST